MNEPHRGQPEIHSDPVRTAIAALLLLGACGDNLTGLAVEELDDSRRAAECMRLVRCGIYADEPTCLASMRPRDLRNEIAAIEAGKLVYDATAAARCHAALAEQSCDTTDASVRVPPAECARILRGRIADGDTCAFDAECVSGHCIAESCPRTACCLGECADTRQPSAPGESCNVDEDCLSGMFCGQDRLCRAPGQAESRCMKDDECAPGLGCVGAGLDPGFCRPLPLLGERCTYLRCAEINTRCDVDMLVCVHAGIGAPCLDDSQCNTQYGRCDIDSGRCVIIPTLGMACDGLCRGEAWCDVMSATCLSPKPSGMACGSDAECETQVCAEGFLFDYCATVPLCI